MPKSPEDFHRRFGWLAVLVGGAAIFELIRQALIQTQNPNFVPALLVIGATVVPAAFVTYWWGRRLAAGVSAGILIVSGVVGGAIGIVIAGVIEYDTLRDLKALQMVGVGLIEESAKLVVPLVLLLLFLRHTSPGTGLLVGVASGAGFAALETMGYAFVTLVASRGDLSAVDGTLLLRGLMSPAAHMAWTGLTAAALWSAAASGWRPRGLAILAITFAAAVTLHATWDTVGSTPAYAVVATISLALLFGYAHWIGRQHPSRGVTVATTVSTI